MQNRYEVYKKDLKILFIACIVAFAAILVGGVIYTYVNMRIRSVEFTNELTDETYYMEDLHENAIKALDYALDNTEKASSSNDDLDIELVYEIKALNRNDEVLDIIEFYDDDSVRVLNPEKETAYWADGELLISYCNDCLTAVDEYNGVYDTEYDESDLENEESADEETNTSTDEEDADESEEPSGKESENDNNLDEESASDKTALDSSGDDETEDNKDAESNDEAGSKEEDGE